MKKATKKSAAALIDARRRYDDGEPLATIAASLNMGGDAFLRFRRRENWPLRSSPIRRKSDEAPKSDILAPESELAVIQTPLPPGPVDVEALRRRLEARGRGGTRLR